MLKNESKGVEPWIKVGDQDSLVTPRFFTGWQSTCARALQPRSVSSRWQLIQTLHLNEHIYEKQLPGSVKVNYPGSIQKDPMVHRRDHCFFPFLLILCNATIHAMMPAAYSHGNLKLRVRIVFITMKS